MQILQWFTSRNCINSYGRDTLINCEKCIYLVVRNALIRLHWLHLIYCSMLKYSDSMHARINCKKYSESAVEIGTHVKPVVFTLEIFAVLPNVVKVGGLNKILPIGQPRATEVQLWPHGRIFLKPPTLTATNFAASWSTETRNTFFERYEPP